MSSKPRYVFNTNAAVSAALYKEGYPGRAFYWALDNGEILLSDEVVREMDEVLSREKFKPYISQEEQEVFLQRLVAETRFIDITEKIQACRDPKDDKFLELAICGNASCVVTGDEDLIVLNPFRGIRILTPRDFVDSIVTEKSKAKE